MKRFMYTGAMLCAMALMTGCSEDEQMAGQAQSGNFSVTATTDAGTRTIADGYSVLWSENDKIYVYGTQARATLELTAGEGTNKGTFTGTIKGDDVTTLKYAVYPVPTIGEGSKSISFPATYTYPYNSNSPMYAVFGANQSNLSFKHLCGMMRLTINGIPSTGAKTLTLTGESNIAGAAPLTEGTDDKLSLGTISGSEKAITITIPDGTTGTTFDIPLPAATYTRGIKVELTVDGKKCITEATKDIEIKAGHMLEMEKLTYTNISGEAPSLIQPVKDVTEANTALTEGKNSVAIEAVDATGGDATVTIPPTGDKAPTTIAVNALQTGDNKLVVKAAEHQTVNQDINLLLGAATPASGGGAEQPKINVEVAAATSHVTVAPTNENEEITIESASVSTSETTFVIEKGVTIKKLTVNGGNVRVNAGAKIEAIEKGSGNAASVIYLYKEEGATIPTNTSDFTVVDATVNDLKRVFANGGSYQLAADASIEGQSLNVPAGKAATLDLNGHTLTADNSVTGRIMVYGTFTLKDSSADKAGKIVASKDYAYGTYDGGIIEIAGEQASMTMESGNIHTARPSNPTDNGQYGIVLSAGGDFTMTGGKIEAGWYAVSGNGNNSTQNSIIQIKGGELISTADYALYLPQSGTTTISGGTVYGAAGGVTIQRGTLNVEGNALITSKGTGSTGNWGDGTGKLGCAAINANARYGDCTINIKGGTLTAESEALISEGNKHTATINVAGGTFSDPSALKYMKGNADVNIRMTSDHTCPGFKTISGQTVTMDLGGKVLTLADPTVGSAGTETNSCQLNEGSAVTFKNGTLQSNNDKIMIQNYCNLTLENMTVTGTNALYVVSNNCGNVKIDNTTITAGSNANQFAFDVCGYSKYTAGVTVTVSGTSTINGKVEISRSAGNSQPMKLNITGGTFNGDLNVDASVGEDNARNIITISGSPTFSGTSWNAYKPAQ